MPGRLQTTTSRSSKLPLALASTTVLDFGPRRDPRPKTQFLFVPRPFMRVEMGPSLRREEGLIFLSRSHICCTVISHECTRSHAASGKVICTLWTPYTLYLFPTMNNIYARYTQAICQCTTTCDAVPAFICNWGLSWRWRFWLLSSLQTEATRFQI
jgi:hypothetical protein